MNWLTTFSFLLILFISQQDYAEGRRGGSGANSKSPWANVNKANAFMKCLIQKIAASPAFPQQEKEDMESIVETMMSAISSMGASHRGNTQAQLQAMNMAFASSMAELVIAEDPGNMNAISVKTDALSKTLHACFKNTMGTVNRQFIAEIKDLIKVFAQEAAAAGEDNDIDDQAQYDSQTNDNMYSISTSTFESKQFSPGGNNLGTTDFGAGTYGGLGYEGTGGPIYGGPGGAPGGPAGDLSGVANALTQALANSKTFRSIFGSGVNSQIAVQIATSAVQSTLSSSLRLGSNVSQGIVSSLQKSILNLGGRIDVNSLSSALSSTLVSGLSSSGVLNSSNAADLGVTLISGILQSASGIAPQFGIRVSQSDLSSDISSVTNVIRTSISSITSSTSLSSINVGGPDGLNLGGPDFGAGAPGGPGYGGPGGASGGPDYGGPGGIPGGSQGPSRPLGSSVSSLLSSPNGLTSPSSRARIQSLASGILNSLGPNGLDVSSLSNSMASTVSRAVSSGLSPSDAKIEALLETMVALVQIISSASISSVNLTSSSGISSSLASSLSVVLA